MVQGVVRAAQHQLGLQRIDHQRLQKADKHPSGTELQSGARGQQRRARHAGGAADHGQRAVTALVAVAQARFEAVAEIVDGEKGAGKFIEAQAEIDHAHLAAMIGAFERVQPGLAADETDRMRGADRYTEDAPGVAIKAAGNVEGQHRSLKGIDAFYEIGIGTGNRPPKADTEQAVDHQSVISLGHFAAGADDDVDSLLLEHVRHHDRIATVVAGAGKGQHAGAAILEQSQGELRGGATGALHQWRHDAAVARFNVAQLCTAQ